MSKKSLVYRMRYILQDSPDQVVNIFMPCNLWQSFNQKMAFFEKIQRLNNNFFYHSCGVDNGSYDSDEVEHVPRIPKVVLRNLKKKRWIYFHISYLKFGTFNGVNCWGNICDTGIYLPFELHTFFHHQCWISKVSSFN